MAAYDRSADLTCEAYQLGAGSAPSWYDDFVTDGTIVDTGIEKGVQTYRVGTLTGWVHCVIGDYVKYTAAGGGAPKSVAVELKASFEANWTAQ